MSGHLRTATPLMSERMCNCNSVNTNINMIAMMNKPFPKAKVRDFSDSYFESLIK
jgi:hypothetical protein